MEMIVAGKLHDAWRESRKRPDGTYEPRVKPDGEGGEVDIANTSFEHLPSKWQSENLASAQSALEALKKTLKLEEASALVHQAWLERNAEWAEREQKCPYELLSEEEKEKDRIVVRTAAQATGILLEE